MTSTSFNWSCISGSKQERVPTSLVTQNSMYFPGYFQIKAMKSKVNLASNQCLCWLCRYNKEVNQNYFCKWYLEKWSLKHRICKFQVFSRFWVKFPGFYHFLRKFQSFSKPGKENDTIPGFQGFSGSVARWEPCKIAKLTKEMQIKIKVEGFQPFTSVDIVRQVSDL